MSNLAQAILILNAKKGWSDAARKKAAAVRKAKKKVKSVAKESKQAKSSGLPNKAERFKRHLARQKKKSETPQTAKLKKHLAKIDSELSAAKASLAKAEKSKDHKEQEKYRMEVKRLEGAKKFWAPPSSGPFPGSGSNSITGSLGSSSLNR